MRTEGEVPPRCSPAVSREQRRERRSIERLVSNLNVPRRDVDDVVQEVMIAAVRAERRFSVPEGADREEARSAWLGGITFRCVANYWRKRARHADLHFQPDVPSGNWHGPASSPSAEALALSRTALVVLLEALSLLQRTAPATHAVVVAHDLDEVPIPEVAAQLGINIHTAWNRLRLGREALRAHFRRSAMEEPPPAWPPAMGRPREPR